MGSRVGSITTKYLPFRPDGTTQFEDGSHTWSDLRIVSVAIGFGLIGLGVVFEAVRIR